VNSYDKTKQSTIIFDLSEVLISGLLGIKEALSRQLPASTDRLLSCFGGSLLDELLLGDICEDTYLKTIVDVEGWEIDISRLKSVIRSNFRNQVEGMPDLVAALAPHYQLVLFSDHAQEWITYIRSVHPFLKLFQHAFFSYELGRLKRQPEAFAHVLEALSVPARRCLFIDDNPVNVAAAHSVGLPSIRFSDADHLVSELRRWGVW
jgi:putative hydrolase of the HAD superfamily